MLSIENLRGQNIYLKHLNISFPISLTTLRSVSSVAQSCPTFCDPRDCSTSGFPVHHQLLELAQTHVHLMAKREVDFLKDTEGRNLNNPYISLMATWKGLPLVVMLLNSSAVPPTGVLAQAEAPCPGETPFLVEFTQSTAKSMLRLEQHRLY